MVGRKSGVVKQTITSSLEEWYTGGVPLVHGRKGGKDVCDRKTSKTRSTNETLESRRYPSFCQCLNFNVRTPEVYVYIVHFMSIKPYLL